MGGFMSGAAGGGTGSGTTTTARITQWVRSTCTRVPASAYGSTDTAASAATGTATAQVLYRCGPGN